MNASRPPIWRRARLRRTREAARRVPLREGHADEERPPVRGDVQRLPEPRGGGAEAPLCAADALWRAVDLGYMPKQGALATPLGQRAALLLTLSAGLLEFPADQNFIDVLWGMALAALNLPDQGASCASASRRRITDASNYYGSVRGVGQLIGEGGALREGGSCRV